MGAVLLQYSLLSSQQSKSAFVFREQESSVEIPRWSYPHISSSGSLHGLIEVGLDDTVAYDFRTIKVLIKETKQHQKQTMETCVSVYKI
ncbi:hypothetical protein STEG23_029561 [Scotinomys teguina]